MSGTVRLEQAAAEFSAQNASSPFLFEMKPEDGRKAVDSVQNSQVFKHPARIEDRETDLGKFGTINVRILRP